MIIGKIIILINWFVSIYDKIIAETIIAGNVNKSPSAAMIGVVILSGFQPLLKLLNETNIVIGSIIKLDINPAITQMKIKSINEIDSKCSIIQNNLAIIAKNKDNINVKTKAEIILSFNSSENLNSGDIKPICRLVESLEAKDPKMFPLIPIAPGIIMINPGNVSKKKVIFPRIIPANKSPKAQINRATKLSFITELCSERKS